MNEQEIASLWERAMAAEQREDWEKARRLYGKVTKAVPGHAGTFQRLGLIAIREGRPDEAQKHFERSLAIDPADPVCLNNLGNVLREQGRLVQAASAYRKALGAKPEYPSALYNLAGTLSILGEHAQAAQAYRELLRFVPGDAEAWKALGMALLEGGDDQGARAALEESLRLRPDDAEVLNALGVSCQHSGDLEKAGEHFRAAIATDPDYVSAYENLVRSRKMSEDDLPLIEPIRAIAEDHSRNPESRMVARFALAKIFDDCRDYDRAFENVAEGNALKRATVSFDPAEHTDWVDRVIDVFDAEFFRTHAGEGDPSERPIFVIGMIRSGTSLVEQILASHSRVHGAGELLDMTNLVASMPSLLGSHRVYPDCLRELDADGVRKAARRYLDAIDARDRASDRVVDKLPTNFLHLGLIATLLPRAHIINCCRDPLDVCVSIYFQRFAQGHYYAYSLDDVAAYYAEYVRLMAHWRSVLPTTIFDIQYEKLLDDLEGESRRMLEHCGLEWEEACLTFYASKREVRTASSWQVRQPLYKSSNARWKNYERHLDALKEGLTRRGVDWESSSR